MRTMRGRSFRTRRRGSTIWSSSRNTRCATKTSSSFSMRSRWRIQSPAKTPRSSVHQAKGLEWRIVFVIWLADGRFPSQRALRVPGGIIRVDPARVHAELPLLEGTVEGTEPQELVIPGEEEERRLFYVAVTRAQQELYLVFPVMARDRGGMDVLMEPSRFVRELPGELYEKWVIDA